MSLRPFEAIPARAAEVLRPTLPGLADEIIATIGREVPDYRRAMSGLFGQMVRLGVETALGFFVDDVEGRGRPEGPVGDTYVNLGRGEFHAGRSLDTLLAAYRVGARLAWRRFVEAGVAGGLEPQDLYSIGEGIFEYIDRLSAESAEGYALEQRAAAGDAGFELPRELAALVVAVPGDDVDDAAERLARGLGHGVLAAALEDATCALVPDPEGPGRRATLEAAAHGVPAALGPAVPWARAGHSIRRAQAALRLVRDGRLDAGGLALAADHLPVLLLGADPDLAAELAAQRLAPLDGLTAAGAARLAATLRAWLDRPGQVQAVAAELGVHPQTVRYRVRRLRELFGETLEDPERRFELALALRARELA